MAEFEEAGSAEGLPLIRKQPGLWRLRARTMALGLLDLTWLVTFLIAVIANQNIPIGYAALPVAFALRHHGRIGWTTFNRIFQVNRFLMMPVQVWIAWAWLTATQATSLPF